MPNLNFNAGNVPRTPREDNDKPMAEGWYRAKIDRCTGQQGANYSQGLNWMFRITGPKYINKCVFELMCMDHSNEDTQRIAQERCAELSEAAGVPVWNNTQQLMGREVELFVYVQKAANGYPARERIKTYRMVGDGRTNTAPANTHQQAKPATDPEFFDDDIPF